MRRLVIGDIHGCGKALRTLVEAIAPTMDDEIVFLGDYIDRGPNSRDVIEQIVQLKKQCRVVALRGNHEIMMLGVMNGGCDASGWLSSGGNSTVASYGGTLQRMPHEHRRFFEDLRPFYETENAIFIHANYTSETQIAQTDDAVAYWDHLGYAPPAPHVSGKTVFVGHTPQANGEVLDWGHIICLDTYCFGGGYLTAMDVQSREVWQVDRHGHERRYRQFVIADQVRSACRNLIKRWRRSTADDKAGSIKATTRSVQRSGET